MYLSFVQYNSSKLSINDSHVAQKDLQLWEDNQFGQLHLKKYTIFIII